ncbi:hypothetical protein [Spirosoma gilvum]
MEETFIWLLVIVITTIVSNILKSTKAGPSTHYFTDDFRDVWSDETPSAASGEVEQRDWDDQNDAGFGLE